MNEWHGSLTTQSCRIRHVCLQHVCITEISGWACRDGGRPQRWLPNDNILSFMGWPCRTRPIVRGDPVSITGRMVAILDGLKDADWRGLYLSERKGWGFRRWPREFAGGAQKLSSAWSQYPASGRKYANHYLWQRQGILETRSEGAGGPTRQVLSGGLEMAVR